MSENILKLPVIPLRGLTVLPGTTVHFDISRKSSIKAAETAMLAGKNLLLLHKKTRWKKHRVLTAYIILVQLL